MTNQDYIRILSECEYVRNLCNIEEHPIIITSVKDGEEEGEKVVEFTFEQESINDAAYFYEDGTYYIPFDWMYKRRYR